MVQTVTVEAARNDRIVSFTWAGAGLRGKVRVLVRTPLRGRTVEVVLHDRTALQPQKEV